MLIQDNIINIKLIHMVWDIIYLVRIEFTKVALGSLMFRFLLPKTMQNFMEN